MKISRRRSGRAWRRIPPPPANSPILPTDKHASKGLSRACSTQAKNGRACGGSAIDGIGLRHLALPRQTHDDGDGQPAELAQDAGGRSNALARIGRAGGDWRKACECGARKSNSMHNKLENT